MLSARAEYELVMWGGGVAEAATGSLGGREEGEGGGLGDGPRRRGALRVAGLAGLIAGGSLADPIPGYTVSVVVLAPRVALRSPFPEAMSLRAYRLGWLAYSRLPDVVASGTLRRNA